MRQVAVLPPVADHRLAPSIGMRISVCISAPTSARIGVPTSARVGVRISVRVCRGRRAAAGLRAAVARPARGRRRLPGGAANGRLPGDTFAHVCALLLQVPLHEQGLP